MQNLNNFLYYFTYAGGFAAGNYVGLIIQEKFLKGTALIRVISGYDLSQLGEKLNEQSIKSTQMEGTTSENHQKTHVMLIIINRKKTAQVIDIIETTTPGVFYSVQDIRYASEDSLNKLRFFNSRNKVLKRTSYDL